MLFLYQLFNCLGYFLIMIILMVIAIATAKSKSAWIWYVIGAGLQLLALSGNQKVANIYGTDMTMYWLVYIGLLIVTAILIVRIYNKEDSKADIKNTNHIKICPKCGAALNTDEVASLRCFTCGCTFPNPKMVNRNTNKSISQSDEIVSGWQCSCGRLHPKYESSCVCGKSKTDIINQSKQNEVVAKTDKVLSKEIPTATEQIRFCRKCGNELLDNSKFCSKCGTEIISEQ